MDTSWLVVVMRVVVLVGCFTFGAALLKFYVSRPRMPKAASASMVCFLFYVAMTTSSHFYDKFVWYQAPIALGGLVCGTVGLWPYIRVRKGSQRG